MNKCILCEEEFENIVGRPIRDMIWDRFNEFFGEGKIEPSYKQICQKCRFKIGKYWIQTKSE